MTMIPARLSLDRIAEDVTVDRHRRLFPQLDYRYARLPIVVILRPPGDLQRLCRHGHRNDRRHFTDAEVLPEPFARAPEKSATGVWQDSQCRVNSMPRVRSRMSALSR